VTTQSSFSLQKKNFVTSFGQIKGSSDSSNSSANHQHPSVDGHGDGLQHFILSYLLKGCLDDLFCLLSCLLLLLLVDPTALFPNIRNLTEIGVHPLRFDSFTKSVLMHTG